MERWSEGEMERWSDGAKEAEIEEDYGRTGLVEIYKLMPVFIVD